MPDYEFFTDASGIIWHNGGIDTTDDHLAFGGHEGSVLGLGLALMPKGGVFLDIGAHVGLWSLNMAYKKHANVVAVEANPQTFDTLRLNIKENEDYLNGFVSPHCVAAWDKEETLHLIDEKGMETGGSTRCAVEADIDDPHTLEWEAQGKTIDSWLSVDPDLVKIDVEGAEAHVLRGMSGVLDDSRPRLIIEMHDMYFGPQIRDETFAVLHQHGYAWNEDVKFGGSYYLIAQPREILEGEPE
jgi:FkbM family methyltransferase